MRDQAHPMTPAAASGVVPSEGRVPEVAEQYREWLEAIPEAGEDAVDGILAAIAAADSPEDLDAPWETDSLSATLDRPIRVLGLRRMPSDYPGGLGWYLLVDAVDLETGERITATTGAISVVAQLVRAAALGALPLDVVLRQSSRPSKSGYYPQHLEILRAVAPVARTSEGG